MRADWPELASILDKALATLEPELDTLREEWRTDAPLLPPTEQIALTEEEQAWLREHPVLRSPRKRTTRPCPSWTSRGSSGESRPTW